MGSSSASLFEFWIFFFKVSLSGECSVLVCLVPGPGLALPPRLFKLVVDFRCGLAAAATPNVVGDIHCTISCLGIFKQAQQQAVIVLNRGLVVVNSRKVAK